MYLLDVNFDDDVAHVSAPVLKVTSDVVEIALSDAETLLAGGKALSAVDRAHTSFHGYLKAVCQDANIPFGSDPSITDLFKLIRSSHPSLTAAIPGMKDVDQILRPMATIVNSMNPLRNNGSVAHPNEHLLEQPEAMLVINAVRTLLHYLNSRLSVTPR